MNVITDLEKLRNKLAPLYMQYEGQYQPQDAYIWIDCRTEEVWADYSGEIGNAVPISVYHGLIQRVPVHANVRGNELADFLESEPFAVLVQRVLDGWEEEWDGNNHVGSLTEDAKAALEEIETQARELSGAEMCSASEWLTNDLQFADGVYDTGFGKITADSTDDELSVIADEIETYAEGEGFCIYDSVFDLLCDLRMECGTTDREI